MIKLKLKAKKPHPKWLQSWIAKVEKEINEAYEKKTKDGKSKRKR